MSKITPDDIDDLAAVLFAELPDDSCKSQLGLLIYREVNVLRRIIDDPAEQIMAMTHPANLQCSKQQIIDKIRTKYVSEDKDTDTCGSQ